MMDTPNTIFSLLQPKILPHIFDDPVNTAQFASLGLVRAPCFNAITDLILDDVLKRFGLNPVGGQTHP